MFDVIFVSSSRRTWPDPTYRRHLRCKRLEFNIVGVLRVIPRQRHVVTDGLPQLLIAVPKTSECLHIFFVSDFSDASRTSVDSNFASLPQARSSSCQRDAPGSASAPRSRTCAGRNFVVCSHGGTSPENHSVTSHSERNDNLAYLHHACGLQQWRRRHEHRQYHAAI